MKRLLGGMVMAAALSGSAFAADLGARTYTKAPAMMAPATNWSGLYIGGNVGYGWGSGNTDFSFLPSPAVFGNPNVSLDTKPTGVVGGAQIGYNWQMGTLVTGLEADIQGTGIKGSALHSPIINNAGLPENAGNFLSADQKLDWFGTVRARLGVTITPDLLLYGTGGLAYGGVNDSANGKFVRFSDGSFSDFPASARKTKAGWTAGAGGEWMFARNWSAKVEYLHVDLGNVSAIGNEVDHFVTLVIPTVKIGYTWKAQENIVRAGVNYHF